MKSKPVMGKLAPSLAMLPGLGVKLPPAPGEEYEGREAALLFIHRSWRRVMAAWRKSSLPWCGEIWKYWECTLPPPTGTPSSSAHFFPSGTSGRPSRWNSQVLSLCSEAHEVPFLFFKPSQDCNTSWQGCDRKWMRHTGQSRTTDLCKTITPAAASSSPFPAIMYPISLFDCRCSQRGTFAEPSSMASRSLPREEPANLECGHVYESDTASVTIGCPFFVAAVYDHFALLLWEP
ncbi:uncharacterized protein LOC119470183 [Cebus imitator]|uniref:uncharacterized protein LOC119470183 n=1 Tax=Cebus imitator TaxID=2715852 RepID=UPI0018986041|nr:uncharacterized protein LOC119470183 [Cebus imitator]